MKIKELTIELKKSAGVKELIELRKILGTDEGELDEVEVRCGFEQICLIKQVSLFL